MKVIEQKIRSLYHSTVFLWLLTAFFHIFSFSCVCLCRHFVWFSYVPRPRTQILSAFILAAILNKFPLSVDKSVTWFLLCARVFSPAAAILESEKTLGTRLPLTDTQDSQALFTQCARWCSARVTGKPGTLRKGSLGFKSVVWNFR